jgi:hypothetical protein
MARMRRLEAAHMLAKFRFVKPVGHEPPQAALALRNVVVTVAMQRMAGIGGCSLPCYHENQPVSPRARVQEKVLEPTPGLLDGRAVKVKLRFIGDEPAGKLLGGSPIKPRQLRRLCWRCTAGGYQWPAGLRTVPWLCRGRGRRWSLAVAALERHNRLLDLIPQGAIGHET